MDELVGAVQSDLRAWRGALIAIIGPTAAGKSALALSVAAHLDGEIVSADSRHVYRRMNIGTNKPTPREQAQVTHHLLDLREPWEGFSLGEYLTLARAVIEDVCARGKTPLLVGGTGQYVRAVLEGWQTPPVPPDESVRARWLAFAQAHGAPALFEQLRQRDPEAARTIDPRNVRRVVRALEVIEATGQPWSAWQRRQPWGVPVRVIYLQPPRDALYARADARLLGMIAAGWLDEVRALLEAFAQRGLDADCALTLPAMSALGYREMAQVALGRLALDEAIAAIKRATRRFIRAQDVWFRRDAAKFGAIVVNRLL
ncbi:MAG: tRNA (adenosine(37)-N6)-dimethylallyltransferase MiaA [Anaerolineae bacterium]|nr:tRNA (adenosine(37)-N6)-dimethylallyltransferase MiaA [Anaerolineae bacterium]